MATFQMKQSSCDNLPAANLHHHDHLVGILLKGLSVIVNSKLHVFPNPQIFLHIQRKLHCNDLPTQQLSGNSIFLKRQTILCCWELIITGDKNSGSDTENSM